MNGWVAEHRSDWKWEVNIALALIVMTGQGCVSGCSRQRQLGGQDPTPARHLVVDLYWITHTSFDSYPMLPHCCHMEEHT